MRISTRYLRELDRQVSRLGLGSMVMKSDREELSFALLDAWVERGGNLVDTAEVYHSEAVIGKWMKARRNRADVVVLTKGCHHPRFELSVKAIPESIGRSLDALDTDYIDLWAFHRDNLGVPVEAIVDVLNEQVSAGRLRAFGASNWSRERIAAANAYAAKQGLMGMAISSPHVCLAVPKEPFWPECTFATKEDLAWYASAGLPVVAWSSQGRGFFLESSSANNTANADLVRVYHNAENFQRLARARELARQKGVAAVQIALAYVLNLPAPIIALVGPETTAQMDMCVQAAEIALSPAEVAWLNAGERA